MWSGHQGFPPRSGFQCGNFQGTGAGSYGVGVGRLTECWWRGLQRRSRACDAAPETPTRLHQCCSESTGTASDFKSGASRRTALAPIRPIQSDCTRGGAGEGPTQDQALPVTVHSSSLQHVYKWLQDRGDLTSTTPSESAILHATEQAMCRRMHLRAGYRRNCGSRVGRRSCWITELSHGHYSD